MVILAKDYSCVEISRNVEVRNSVANLRNMRPQSFLKYFWICEMQ
jgi:hypothetical protein